MSIRGMTDTDDGVPTLLRFLLRRERRALPIWLAVMALLAMSQSLSSQSFYDTPEKLANLRATTEGNAAIVAMSGPTELLDTVGGEFVFEIFSFLAIVVALMNMFLVGRNTRADEETGRAELLRSARIGRRSPLLAALALAALADVGVFVVMFAVTAGTGLPVGGSLLFSVAVAVVGLSFAMLTAVAVQVFESPRGVYFAVTGMIGLAYALRAVGDVGNEALSWLSPIGWGVRTFPYAGDRWWPLLIPLAVMALLLAAAFALLDHRDFGDGVVQPRPGPATASRALGSPLGLAWRLHRMPLLGWALGIFTLGVMYGSVGKSIEDYVADNPDMAEFFGGSENVVDSYLAVTLAITVLLAIAYGVSAALRARGEETSGRVEPILAAQVSRYAWLGSHVTIAALGSVAVLALGGVGIGLTYGLSVSDPGQAARMFAASFAYVPAVFLVVAVAVLVTGVLPRAAAAVAWTLLGYATVITVLGDSLDLPDWAQALSPLYHTPQVPLDDVTATPLLVMSALAVVGVGAGMAGLRGRDMETS